VGRYKIAIETLEEELTEEQRELTQEKISLERSKTRVEQLKKICDDLTESIKTLKDADAKDSKKEKEN
jgi:hypothetical protein